MQNLLFKQLGKSLHLHKSKFCTCPILSKESDGRVAGTTGRLGHLFEQGSELNDQHDTQRFESSSARENSRQVCRRGTKRRRIISLGRWVLKDSTRFPLIADLIQDLINELEGVSKSAKYRPWFSPRRRSRHLVRLHRFRRRGEMSDAVFTKRKFGRVVLLPE